MSSFDSTDDKRVQNNPAKDDYSGPDDVALSYRALSEDDKTEMREFKIDCQTLINKLRTKYPDGHPELEYAIRHIIDASANITRYITRFKENTPKHDVYSNDKCTFVYCPTPEICKASECQNKAVV